MDRINDRNNVRRMRVKDYSCFKIMTKVFPKNTTDNPLKWFNRISFLFGLCISVHEHGRLMRIYHGLHGLIVISHAIKQLIFWSHYFLQGIRLFKLDALFFFVGQIVYALVIHLYGHAMFGMIKDMSMNLTRKQRKFIEIISIVFWIPLIIERILMTFFLINRYHFTLEGIFSIMYKSICVSHVFHVFSLHLLFIITCYFSCSNRLQRMKKLNNPLVFIQTVFEIEKQVDRVNKIAIIPFSLLMPRLFILLPSAASHGPDEVQGLDILLASLAVGYTFILLIHVVTVIVLKRKLESKRQVVLEKLITSHERSSIKAIYEWKQCLERLKEKQLFDFSVMSLFSIDFSFLMSLSSAVISFSILFFQMENKNNSK